MRRKLFHLLLGVVVFIFSPSGKTLGGEAKSARGPEWDKSLEAAKKEGKVVVGIPPSTELRREMEVVLKQKLGLEAELVSAPGPRNASRIASERKAGVSYFDAFIVAPARL